MNRIELYLPGRMRVTVTVRRVRVHRGRAH